MDYKLEQLDAMVMTSVHAARDKNYSLSQADLTRIMQETLQQTEQIKATLVREVFLFTKEKEIEVYVKNYQLASTHLLDRLYAQEQAAGATKARTKTFYQSLYASILALLSFIEERFSKYFDKMEKVPDVYLALTKKELAGKQAAVQLILEGCAEPAVTSPLLGRIEQFIKADNPTSRTWRDIMFYKELVKELEDMRGWKNGEGVYSGLHRILIYLNYNAKEYVNGMVNRVMDELQGLGDINEKMDRLFLYAKTLNQLQLKPDCALLPAHPSVKTQLSNWFAEELQYQERKLAGLTTGKNIATGNLAIKNKIICKVPVDQLGIFFRAASEIELIATPHQKALFEHFAPLLSTAFKADLSADSMRSKSYAPEKKDIEAVKDFLMRMFRQVGKY